VRPERPEDDAHRPESRPERKPPFRHHVLHYDRAVKLSLVLFFVAGLARAGTLDDMEIRSNVEGSIRGTARTAMLHLKIDVDGGVVIPRGVVHDLDQADDVVQLASKIKGVREVDRAHLKLEFEGPPDEQLAQSIERQVLAIPKFSSTSPHAAVKEGIVTLTGKLKNASWRLELRSLCGAIEGVVDVVDLLETPETPDDRIQAVLDASFGPRVTPPFPGRVQAIVKEGTVTLTGRVPRLFDRVTAEQKAWGVNGVRHVDNHLEMKSGTSIEVVRP
jgi:osmotically-inducible protein OsmY